MSGRFPDFLCIGVQKGGTTWLHAMLEAHPNVWVPPVKELYYFNQIYITEHREWPADHRRNAGLSILQNLVKQGSDTDFEKIRAIAEVCRAGNFVNDEWYRGIFDLAPLDALVGEVTPDYCLLPLQGIRHILAYRRDVKIILILRDPIERAWSQVRMKLKQPPATWPEVMAALKDPYVLARGEYQTILPRWSALIPGENLKVLMFDDIATQPAEFLMSVCDFLGLPYDPNYFPRQEEKILGGVPAAIPDAVYKLLKAKYERDIQYVAEQYGGSSKEWLARHYG